MGDSQPAADPEMPSDRPGAAEQDLLHRLEQLLRERTASPTPSAGAADVTNTQGPVLEGSRSNGDVTAVESASYGDGTDTAHAAGSSAPTGHAPQTVYRYRGRQGREVFTNIAESVPVVTVESTKMELDHIPLNSELGTEINRRLVKAHERLTSTPFCQQVRAELSELPPSSGMDARAIWEGYAPIVVCAAILLLMFLITPAMHRRVDPNAWRRVMMFAIPALAVAAGITQSMMHVGNSVMSLRQAAKICDPQALVALPVGASPLSARLDLITTLQNQMARVEAVHYEVARPIERARR